MDEEYEDEEFDRALASDKRFIDAMTRLAKALDETEIDWDKIKKVEWPPKK